MMTGIKSIVNPFFSKIRQFAGRIGAWITRCAERSWKGAAIGAVAAMVFYLVIMGSFFDTGISVLLDIFLVILGMVIVVAGTGFLAKGLFSVVRKFNPYFVGAFVASFVIAGFFPHKFFSQPFILFELVCGALVGFALSKATRKYVSIILIIIVLAANGFVFYSLFNKGVDQTIPVSEAFWQQKTSPLPFDDLSKEGNYKVETLFYGSGTDKQRPEYGSQVDLRTEPVDATPFFDQTSGFNNYMREVYWGFNSKNYPLNARVWYPEGNGPFPLVLIVHGNHLMNDFSDPGYEYLGILMASRGFILASVDENFLNGGWMGDYQQQEIFTRAWLLLKHLEQWRQWSQTDDNPFYGKVDMNNIALMGHSRGGATVAVASVINRLKRYHINANQEFNFNFSIKGIVQIAPNDPYNPQSDVPLEPENIDYLLLQGGYDQDMWWFLGNRVYNRVTFTDGQDHFKAALYIYRANHGQFNTVWGRKDNGIPVQWFMNTRPIMDGDDQRRIAKLYITAFLEASLKGQTGYLSLFRDFRQAGEVLPEDYYINQYEDAAFRYIADYQEDFDVNTASFPGCSLTGENVKTWSENALPFRDDWGSSQQTCGVYLGWDRNDTTLKGPSAYTIHLSDSARALITADSCDNLFFFICNNRNDIDTVDFTIELAAGDIVVTKKLSDFRILPPPLKTKLTKFDRFFTQARDKPVERVLQYVEIPFAAFIQFDETFAPSELTHIRFLFDQTTTGEIFLDKIGLN